MHKKRISTKILQWAKKVKVIEILGGKCEHCGNYNIFHLTFHHTDSTEKEYRKLYYEDGLRQIDIAKKLNCGKSTIQYQLIQLKKIYGEKI